MPASKANSKFFSFTGRFLQFPPTAIMLQFTRLLLITLLVCLIDNSFSIEFEPMPKSEYYTRPEYGVIFRPMSQQFIPTDSVTHVFFQLDFPKIPNFPIIPDLTTDQCYEKSPRHREIFRPTNRETKQYLFQEHAHQFNPYYDHKTEHLAHPAYIAYLRTKVSDNKSVAHISHQRHTEGQRRKACNDLTLQLNQTLTRYKALRADLLNDYNGLTQLLQQNAVTEHNRKRTVRAIFSFLQPAFSTLFGFSTEDQIQQVQENLQRVQQNQYAVSNNTEKLYHQVAYLTNITSRRLDILWQGLADQNANINQTTDAIKSLAGDISKGMARLGKSLQDLHQWNIMTQSIHEQALNLNMDAMMVKSKLGVWTRSLTQLIRQYLPSELVTPYELRTALVESIQTLGDRKSSFRIVHDEDDLHYYYTERLTKLFITHDTAKDTFVLHIYLKVPIAVSEIKINAFQIITVKVPVHTNGSLPGKGYTQIGQIQDYFIISETKNSYAELSAADYEYCSSLTDNICPALSLNRDKHDMSCLAALFFNEHRLIKQKCTFNYFPLGIPPTYAIFIREGIYLIASKSAELQFICPQFAKRTKYAYFALVKVPCNCAVSSQFLYIPPSLANCDLPTVKVLFSFPFNMVQLSMESGFDAEQILADQYTFEFKPPTIETPDFSMLATLTDLQHEDEALQLNLDTRQIGRLSQKVTIQELKAIDYGSSVSYEFIHTIIHYCLETVSLLANIFLSIKLYRLTIIINTLQRTAEAYLLTASTTLPAVENPISINTISQSNTILLFFTAVLICTLVQISRYTFKRIIRRSLKPISITETTVYLVFTDINNSHVKILFTINECVQHIILHEMPAITDTHYQLKCYGKPQVHLTWAHPIIITVLGLVREIDLPRVITLPLPIAKLLLTNARTTRTDNLSPSIAIALKSQCSCGCRLTKSGISAIFNPNRAHLTTEI